MATIAMMVGGAIVNALAFFLFSNMRGLESKRHNKALEQLEAAQTQWTRRKTERLDFINEEMHRQGHSVQTFKDVESGIHEYFLIDGKKLGPMPKPTISQFYTPSEEQKNARSYS